MMQTPSLMSLLCGLLAWLFFAGCVSSAASRYPLKVSGNHRYLVDQHGRPFFVLGDSPWNLQKVKIEDAIRIMDDRKAKGFNTLMLEMLDDSKVPCQDFYGHSPFQPETEITRPVEAYWQHVDRVLEEAEKRGFFVIISDIWYGAGEGLWMHHLDPQKAAIYGRFLGKRYARFKNLMWLHVGDRLPNAMLARSARELASVMHAAAPHQLHTVHLQREFPCTSLFNEEPWLDVAMAYCGGLSYLTVLREYQQIDPVRPVILGEQGYEGDEFYSALLPDADPNTRWTAYQVRRNAWWAVTCGASGYCAGTRLWRFEPNWPAVLDIQSSMEAPLLVQLLESRPWWKLVPDVSHELLTEGWGSWRNGSQIGFYATAARAEDGSLALVYMPSKRSITIDFGQLRGPVHARWYDPTSGALKPVEGSPFPATGSRQLTAPSKNAAGQTDWVLVLETVAAAGGGRTP